jgi:hypothetical protein
MSWGSYELDKQEASNLLNELLATCNFKSTSFVLLEPDPKDSSSAGYKIRVKTMSLNNECQQQLKSISREHDCAIIEEDTQIIVYSPKSIRIERGY